MYELTYCCGNIVSKGLKVVRKHGQPYQELYMSYGYNRGGKSGSAIILNNQLLALHVGVVNFDQINDCVSYGACVKAKKQATSSNPRIIHENYSGSKLKSSSPSTVGNEGETSLGMLGP